MSMEPRWDDTDRENPKNWIIICPSATLPTTNPTWTDPNANPGLPNRMLHLPTFLHLSHLGYRRLLHIHVHHTGFFTVLSSLLSCFINYSGLIRIYCDYRSRNGTYVEENYMILATMMMSVLFWVVMPCGLGGNCQLFGQTYCLRPSSALEMKAVCSSKTSISTYKSTWRYNPDQHRHNWKRPVVACV
jgi:hypothetical protein